MFTFTTITNCFVRKSPLVDKCRHLYYSSPVAFRVGAELYRGRKPMDYSHSNVQFLVDMYGGQTRLAAMISTSGLTQPKISQILYGARRGRWCRPRRLKPLEAWGIEQDLGIPDGWVRVCDLREVWHVIAPFRELPAESRKVLSPLIVFLERRARQPSL